MIKIIINGQPIELLPDTYIDLRFQSPLFYNEGTYSLPISMANSLANKRLLNFPARIGNASNARIQYDCELVANSFRLKGVLIVNSISQQRIEAYYTDGIGQFNYEADGKYLTDINDPDPDTFPGVNEMFQYLQATPDYEYPNRKYVCFPCNNLNLFNNTKEETYWVTKEGQINRWDPVLQQFYFYLNEYNIPHFFLVHVLNRLFSTFGITVAKNLFHEHAELRQLVVLSDFFKNTTGITTIPYNPSAYQFNMAWYLPRYLIKSFLSDLRAMFFCEFFVNNASRTVNIKFLKDVLTTVEYEDISDKADKNYSMEFEEEEDGYEIGFNIESSDEMMSTVRTITGFLREDDVDSFSDLPAYSGTQQQHENEIRLVRDQNNFYFFYYAQSTGLWTWGLYTPNMISLISGNGDLQRKSSTNPTRMEVKNDLYIPHTKVQALDLDEHPFADEGGLYTLMDPDWIAQNTPRLAFWHGKIMYDTPNHRQYPFASPDCYWRDIYGVWRKVTGKNLSLSFTGTGNLVENFGQEFLHWWFNVKKYTRWQINWNTVDLHNLDFSQKYRIGNQNYLVKSVNARINASGNIEIGETELVLT